MYVRTVGADVHDGSVHLSGTVTSVMKGFKCAVLLSLPLFASAHCYMESIYMYIMSLKIDAGI